MPRATALSDSDNSNVIREDMSLLPGKPEVLVARTDTSSPAEQPASEEINKAFLKKASKILRKSKPGTSDQGPPKAVNLLRKAINLFNASEYHEALQLALKATEIHPENAIGHHLMALALSKLGETHKALLMFERALELDPTEFDVYLSLGLTAIDLKMEEAAEKFYRIYIDLKPDSFEGYNNLGCLLRDQNRFDDAIEIVRHALNLMPETAELWNTMATIAGETQRIEEAITFYDEALRVDPDFRRARFNQANLQFNQGRTAEALDGFEKFIGETPENHPDTLEGRHALAQALLSRGRFQEGWREYQIRNEPLFRASTLFAVEAPLWNGEDIRGKNILVIGEQGIGDEILFANPIRDLIEQVGESGNVLISVTDRLVDLFQRAYPECKVASPAFTHHNGKLVHLTPWHNELGKLDYYSPMADLSIFLRPTIESYQITKPIISPDPEAVQDWKVKLAEISDGPFVGICWRSGVLTAGRQKLFASLDLWQPILEKEGITLVNLQYGDVEDEIREIEKRFGKTIHQMEGLDVRNDLNGNAALCAALDLTVSAATAASAIAAGVGTETWIMLPKYSWVLLGETEYPWYTNTRAFSPEKIGMWETALEPMAAALDTFIENRK